MIDGLNMEYLQRLRLVHKCISTRGRNSTNDPLLKEVHRIKHDWSVGIGLKQPADIFNEGFKCVIDILEVCFSSSSNDIVICESFVER